MKRLASAFVALAVLAAPAAIAQGKMDCGKAYKGFWEKIDAEKYAKIAPEQLAVESNAVRRGVFPRFYFASRYNLPYRSCSF